ncbi:hypothetical protein AAVH_25085 [Aphelenchoides avenae]|nr:hypothetical protein AAVH_25085 [Aphelenchus avenae]
MSKLFVAVLAFSTVSLAVGHRKQGYQGVRLDLFLDNPKIKLLANPSVQGAYPGDDTDYSSVVDALAALPEPVTVERVKEVLRERAPKLYRRVQAAVESFDRIRDRAGGRGNISVEARAYLTRPYRTQYGPY